MISIRRSLRPADAGRALPRLPVTVVVFVGAATLMLVLWLLLAALFSGIGGGRSVATARGVIATVTSSTGESSALEVRAILATPEYFAVTDRSTELFGAAPERALEIVAQTPTYFDAFDASAAALGLDPQRYLPVLIMLDVHEGDDLPDPSTWLSEAFLDADGTRVPPRPGFNIAFRSEHHQTVAVQFPRFDEAGRPLIRDDVGSLRLSIPDMDSGGGSVTVQWAMPLEYPSANVGGSGFATAATFGSMLAVMAGLLVIFSPCAVHMTAYFLPLITGLGMKEILDRTAERQFRAHVASLGFAFVSGFVVLYTLFGVAAGFAGQFFSNTEQFSPYIVPLRIVSGIVVIYMALHTLGVFRMPFVLSLALPGRPHAAGTRQGYAAAAIAGMSISIGCLTCVGGTLLASLLLYAGASGSPLMGGLTLFLFSTGMSIPFLLAALAFDKVVPRYTGARTVLRHSTTVAGTVMLAVGLLILSGNDSVFENLVV